MEFATDRDAITLQQVRAGQPAALLDLYDRYAQPIFAQAYATLGDLAAAEDVVQETFTAAWFEVTSWFRAPRNVFEWLVEIARERLAARTAHAAAPPAAEPSHPIALPRGLRDRVLDSIYGAGERLRPPFARPQWTLEFSGRWIVWVLAIVAIVLIALLA